MFSSEAWLAKSGGFYNGVATQSLRFDGGAKLTRTPSSSGNQKKWTSSFWVKRSGLGTTQYLWSGGSYSGNDGIAAIYFSSDDKIHTYFDTSGANPYGAVNDRLYRDTSAWYHIVWAVDAENTVQKIWVNGVEETLASGNNPPNYDYGMNRSGTLQAFGIATWGGSPNLNGYLAEITHLDGQYLDETYFGEFKNGVWIAKDTSDLTFGTNGFILKLDQTGVGTASSSTIGADTSGNTNHYTSSGIVASDCNMPDSPENNWCTLNPLNKDSVITLSEGNLKTGGGNGEGGSTFGVSSGKWYWELRLVDPYASIYWGLHGVHNVITQSVFSGGAGFYALNSSGGGLYANGSLVTAKASGWATGDIIGLAYDADNLTLGVYQNNSQIGSNLTVPNAFNFPVYFQNASGGDTSSVLYNFGQDGSFAGGLTGGDIGDETDGNGNGVFKYAPPSGYLALCTANLPEPTISPNADTQADDYFNTVLYTGDDTDGRSITGVGFQPDWTWIKARNASGNYHLLFDSSRGATKMLFSNDTSAESTQADSLSAFNSDGFTVSDNASQADMNASAHNYVGWNWKANGGTTSSNTDGSITSTVQANTDAGFSIVTYTGRAGATDTIGHGLGVVPAMYIVKRREAFGTPNWAVYHKGVDDSAPQNFFMRLDTSVGRQASSTMWNNTAPTSSVFSIGTSNLSNYNQTFVAYCFAEVDGYSKFGSYVGNNSDDGTFVYLGFRPAWVMIKSIGIESWYIWDSKRETENPVHQLLMANSANAENDTAYTQVLDFVSNGFKIREDYWSGNGVTYIYMAFAENPFKYANAR